MSTNTLPVLNTIASQILACNSRTWEGKSQIDKLLRENPEAGKVKVTYSYTLEYGSDGCWDRTEHGSCTLREWVSGRVMDKHPGNRSYNFQVTKIEA
jgi:hypothetical protein